MAQYLLRGSRFFHERYKFLPLWLKFILEPAQLMVMDMELSGAALSGPFSFMLSERADVNLPHLGIPQRLPTAGRLNLRPNSERYR